MTEDLKLKGEQPVAVRYFESKLKNYDRRKFR